MQQSTNMGASGMHARMRRGIATAHSIGPISSKHADVMALHQGMRTKARRTRTAMHHMGTTMKRTGTAARKRTATAAEVTLVERTIGSAKSGPGQMRAREVVGGLSPQQINPVKVRLSKEFKDKFVPAYTVLFHAKGGGNLASGTIRGITLEDGSERKREFSVVSNAGLMPVACPPDQAELFQWGDYVRVTSSRVKMGYAATIPDIPLVAPCTSPDTSNCIGRFCGWPTNNPKDGGVLVLLKL